MTVIVGLLVATLALPQEWKTWAPGFLRSPALHLGLDLAGGTQLDFRISEDEIAAQLATVQEEIEELKRTGASAERLVALQNDEQSILTQQKNLVEAIRTVLERRINGLGVSEATITPSYVGDEKHLLVECPGIIDTQKCIEVVGKTIQLEFKEEQEEATEEFAAGVRQKVRELSARLQNGSTLEREGQDIGDELGVGYQERALFFFDTLPRGLENIWDAEPFTLVEQEGSIPTKDRDAEGNVTERDVKGIFLAATLGPRTMTGRTVVEAPRAFTLISLTQSGVTYITHATDVKLDPTVDPKIVETLRTMQPGALKTAQPADGSVRLLFLRGLQPGQEEIAASHILVQYKGATGSLPSVTRSKAEAVSKAQALKERLNAGESFEAIAQAESDGPSGEQGGSLGYFSRGDPSLPFAVKTSAFALAQGSISEPVESEFGYHIVRADGAVSTSPDTAKYEELILTGRDAMARATNLIAQMENGQIQTNEETLPVRFIFFSLEPTGWKDTALDGTHFRSATVTMDPTTNIPVVQIQFDEEGGRLFQELTKRNIQKTIAIFVGGQLISDPTVQQEIIGGTAVITGSKNFEEARLLAQELNTGAIPAPIHLVGQHTVEATLGAQALRTSLQAALIGILILMVYMVAVYRLLGFVANIALVIYALLFVSILKMPLFLFSSTYIVLTLAGMAGIILSLGMAVDANVLVFERMKEELRKGKLAKTAVETSFVHAWPAIRDGNVSTLITCLILFIIGTSIVRGFAITLGMGVLLSMFTAITVTRWILRRLALTGFLDALNGEA